MAPYPHVCMTNDKRRGPEEPLHTRPRLSVPVQPVGEKPTKFANMSVGLNALLFNVLGLLFTLTGAFMSDWLGVAGWILTLFGVIVLFWSFVVTLYANRRVSRRREVLRVFKTNVMLIVVAVVLILIPDSMSYDGKVVLAAGAFVTLGFAIAQFLAARPLPDLPAPPRKSRAKRGGDPSP